MSTNRFPPPPRPSLPREAPWTDAENSLDALNGIGSALAQTNTDLEELLAAIQALGGTTPTPGGYGLYIYEDFGSASNGNNTSLLDQKKSWQPNMWAGHTLFVVINSILYVSTIASNGAQNLTFTLPTGVNVPSEAPYWIQAPAAQLIYYPPVQVDVESPRAIGTITTPVMDVRLYRKIIVKIESTLDQAINCQLIGDFFSPMSVTFTTVNGVKAIAAGNITPSGGVIALAAGDWQPFLALQITSLVAPTVGTVTVWLAGQD